MRDLGLPEHRAKQIRAEVIAEHVRNARIRGVVCFTCGNAADALTLTGIDVIEVGERGKITPRRWWPAAEIARCWPLHFDATSGHLPVSMMLEVGKRLYSELGKLDMNAVYKVPSGSGETLVCLKLAYPEIKFAAVYDNKHPHTAYNSNAPLNRLVELLAETVIIRS